MKKELFKDSPAFISDLPLFEDIRGGLSFAEVTNHVPFNIKRCFWIFNVPANTSRGGHAHKKDHQYLICAKGRILTEVIYFNEKILLNLEGPNMSLYLPPLTWNNLISFSNNAVLIVLSSDKFNTEDYIDNFNDYLTLKTND